MERLMLECAVRAALIGLGTAAALALLRVKSAGARHAAWSGVVALMLALPAWMAWGPRVSLPLLPAPPPAAVTPVAFTMPAAPLEVEAPVILYAPRSHWNWLAIVYGAGVFVLLLRLALGTLRARALVRSATVRDGHLTSTACAAPVTVGWLRPAMILPENWGAWPQAQLDAVLVHESAHIRRRDPLVEWLALLNRAIFWFHPLAWWLERRLSVLAEEACDAAVLARGCDPHEYSGYLLELARSVGRTGARVRLGMAMPGSALPGRIGKILAGSPVPRVSRARALALALACACLSALLGAANLDRQPFVPAPPLPAAPPSTPISKAEPPAPEQEPQQPVERRLMALYFDLDGAIPDLQARSGAAAIAIVQQHTNPNDRLAIMQWRGGSVKMLQDFTNDHERLIATIQKLVSNPDADPGEVNGLLAAVKMLGAVEGKKSLIYFAMPPLRVSASADEVRTIVGAAQAANVALFPIDVTGFTAGAQVGEPIRVGDVLTLTLEFGTVHRRGVRLILRAARAEYDSINAPFDGHTFTVGPDGMVSVPGLGDVQAAGLTTAQLESTLGPALAARLSTPKFAISGVTIEKH
jgi:hypothetical protein